jgi:hypothetical protein
LSLLFHAPAFPQKAERRVDLLPLINPPSISRLAGCPTARATWGDVCSLARRISWFDESGSLYETCFLLLVGVLRPFAPLRKLLLKLNRHFYQ